MIRRLTTIAAVVAISMVGTACGELASSPTERPSASVTLETEATGESDADATRRSSARAETVPPESVETVDFVPVAPLPAGAGDDETTPLPDRGSAGLGRIDPGVYDLSIRVAADGIDGPVEDARLMMAREETADRGEK
ncbi:MAG: hypothetical protein ABEN55_11215, partial [Bradymonadaceae bacterium]